MYVTNVIKVVVAIVTAWLLAIIEALVPLFGFGTFEFTYSTSTCLPSLDTLLGPLSDQL